MKLLKMKINITSAAGIIALLDEPMPELKIFALRKLDNIVDEFWPEISESIEKIEMLYEDKIFGQYELAALVASKEKYFIIWDLLKMLLLMHWEPTSCLM